MDGRKEGRIEKQRRKENGIYVPDLTLPYLFVFLVTISCHTNPLINQSIIFYEKSFPAQVFK